MAKEGVRAKTAGKATGVKCKSTAADAKKKTMTHPNRQREMYRRQAAPGEHGRNYGMFSACIFRLKTRLPRGGLKLCRKRGIVSRD